MAKLEAVTCCRFNFRVNSLWLWWYAVIVLVGHTYLMYRAVQQCKEYNELPWRSDQKPVAELYVYICLLVLSIMCMPFFVMTAVFKVGNYANDGVRLGRDDVREAVVHAREEAGEAREGAREQEDSGRAQGLWKHLPPLCNALHVTAAFVLLLPRILLDAQKIRYGFYPPGEIWRSELDVILEPGSRHGMLSEGDATSRILPNQTAKPTVLSPNDVPTIYNILPVSPEFVNWILALVIYSLRYPAVYWYTRKIFSMVFAFLLFAAAFQYTLAYCAIGILYKYQVNANMYSELQLVLPFQALIVLYLLTNIFVFVSSISIFNYGYYHYDEAYRKFLAQHQYHRSRRKVAPVVGCQGYVPHSVATITLMLFVASRATVVYDVVTLYRKTNSKILLASVVWDVSYMLIWIITWFIFTIKQSWGFRIWSSALADSTSDVYTIRNEHARDSTLMQNPPPQIPVTSQNGVVGNGSVSRDNVNVDVVDSPPNSPSSAIRRSGERRSGERRGGNVRVTFEEDDEPSAEDLGRQSPRRRSKEGKETPSRRRKRRSEHPDADGDHGRGFRRSYEDRPKNVFGDFPLQETPENTLTRSYRHSIRDKCGQYYRHSREFQSPPAAQSSPVLGQRNSDHSHEHSPSRDSIPHDLPPRDLPPRDIPPRDIPPRDIPPRELPPRDPLPQRRSGSWEPERPPRPARNISPSRSQPQPQVPVSSSHMGNKPPPVGGERVLPPLPNSLSNHKSRPTSHTPGGFSRTNGDHGICPSNSYLAGMVRNNLSTKPPIGGTTRGSDRHTHPNRDIRVIAASGGTSKKPEMGRRDSALPSSNETSSNDSSDNVLCSQV